MEKLTIHSSKRIELIDITSKLIEKIEGKIEDGIVICYNPHTTAGLLINEHADPDVAYDIENFLLRLIPHNFNFTHSEGNSDAHIKSVITGNQLCLIVEKGKIQLGRWQGIFFAEYDGPRTREIWIKFLQER
ncbi:MAG: secondary thiamine-phosphate synthase enzyme YjbQ [Spirochaetota bacterium]